MIEFSIIFTHEPVQAHGFLTVDSHCAVSTTLPLFYNEDKTLLLVCSGVIDNAEECRNFLKSRDHAFTSRDDRECILHLYEEYGADVSTHLRGAFAFVIYDRKKEMVFASRDSAGEKSLYYAHQDSAFICSSSLKRITQLFPQKIKLNRKSIADSIGYSFPMGEKDTCIEGIYKVPQGSNCCGTASGAAISSYWSRNRQITFHGTEQEAGRKVLDSLRESVCTAMGKNKASAILLSGGVDSSAIAALAREEFEEVHVLTAGYKGDFPCDERRTAQRFAEEKKLIFHEVELTQEDYDNAFEEYPSYLDEPICDIAAIAQWCLCKKAGELGFHTLLGGNGSDEIFYGYAEENHYGELVGRPLLQWCNVFKPGWWPDIKTILRLLRKQKTPFILLDRNKFINALFCPHFAEDLSRVGTLPGRSLPQLESADVQGYYTWLWKNWLPNNCLALSSKFADALDLEIRSPFLDRKLCELVFSLPHEYKYRSGETKYLLKRILNGIVPDYILNPPKKGFSPPMEYIRTIVAKKEKSSFNVLLTSEVCRHLTGQEL